MRPRTLDDWRKAVFRGSKLASAGCRVYLLYLAEYMNRTTKIVSRGRHLVAADLNVSERVVNKYNSEAIDAGFLSVVVRGRKGVTAVYQGTFPERVQREHIVPAETASQGERFVPAENDRNVPPETPFRGNTWFPPSSNAGTPVECVTPGCWGCERCAG